MRRLWFVLGASLISIALSLFVKARATTIVGDSHVGGLKPYLAPHMRVYFKNGSTSAYWAIRKKITAGALIVLTGTNDSIAGVSAKTWLSNTDRICQRAKRCYIVAPKYQPYRSILSGRQNVIYTSHHKTRDGVHMYPSGYRQIAGEILRAVEK